MYVANYMTKDVVTIQVNATISDALSLMTETNVHRIPVMKKDKLVGLITDGNIQKASPTKATSLSIFEINYLLAKTSVADYMTKQVYTITSTALLEEAVREMREHNVSCLPVIDNDQLVGIITEDDVFDAMLDLLGFTTESTRIDLEVSDAVGVMADITNRIKEVNGNIMNVVVFKNEPGIRNIVIRVDTHDTARIEAVLKDAGYNKVAVSRTSIKQ